MNDTLFIYYDGECPLCENYTRLLSIKKKVPQVNLIDLRSSPDKVANFSKLGFDVDQGMIVDYQSRLYHGADAVNLLAQLSDNSSSFNRLNSFALANKHSAKLLYPLLRMGRNAVIFMLGKQSLGHKKNSEDHSIFVLFSFAWLCFSVLHFIVYATQYSSVTIYWSTYGVLIFGLAGIFSPRPLKFFIFLMAVSLIDSWQQMPTLSNHTILQNFFLLSVFIGFIITWSRGENRSDFIDYVKPCGRVLLLTMYFFGVFHKLNTDFLDPSVSCAVVLWQAMPYGLNEFDSLWMRYITIYGALLVETAIFIMLLIGKLRPLGILLGVIFHSMLALSNYAFYAPFSMLTIVLHLFFLSDAEAHRICHSATFNRFIAKLRSPLGAIVTLIWFGAIYALAHVEQYSSASTLWLFLVAFLLYLLITNANFKFSEDQKFKLISKSWLINGISILFIFNCLSPYFGLKSAQALNMFANLRLENGISNHIVLNKAPSPFGYLKDVVYITESSGSGYFQYIINENLYITYYDLLNKLERSPLAMVSYLRNGQQHTFQSSATLQNEIEQFLHPRWFRKWLNFTPVDLQSPKQCALNR